MHDMQVRDGQKKKTKNSAWMCSNTMFCLIDTVCVPQYDFGYSTVPLLKHL